MMTWWHGLSGREKLLISSAVILTLVLGGFQFVYKPLEASRDRAMRGYQRQVQEQNELFSNLAVLANKEAAPDTSQNITQSMELILSRTSQARQLEIVRIQPSGEARLVWFENAEAPRLAQWIAELESQNGLIVTAADLRKRNENGNLRGSIQVKKVAGQ